MLIGELCQRGNVTKDTVRHYDSLDLLVYQQRIAGSRSYRDYAEENVERIELVRLFKFMGFTLREISELLSAYFNGDVSKAEQVALLEERLLVVRQKQSELAEVETFITNKLALYRENAA